jgi:hypothetical protein
MLSRIAIGLMGILGVATVACGEGSDAPRCRNAACGGSGGTTSTTGSGGTTQSGALAFLERWGDGAGAKVRDVAIDEDGNVYAVGFFTTSLDFDGVVLTTEPDAIDMFLAKIDPAGEVVWAHHFGQSHIANAVADEGVLWASVHYSASGIVVGGPVQGDTVIDTMAPDSVLTQVGPNTDVFVAGLTTDGDYIWKTAFGTNGVEPVIRDIDGDANTVVVAGRMDSLDLSDAGGSPGVFVLKMGAKDGAIVWSKSLTSAEVDTSAYGVALSSEGTVAVGGFFVANLTDPDVAENELLGNQSAKGFVAALDSDGSVTDMISLRDENANLVNRVRDVTRGSHGWIIGGINNGTLDFGGDATLTQEGEQGFVAEIHDDLTGHWVTAIHAPLPPAIVNNLSAGPNDTVDVVGLFNGIEIDAGGITVGGELDEDIFYVRLDANGEAVSAQSFSGPGYQTADSVATNSAGDVAFGGHMVKSVSAPGFSLESMGVQLGQEDLLIGLMESSD